jgi:two-component system, NarL family, nitrate/nitrite response regulator NarL
MNPAVNNDGSVSRVLIADAHSLFREAVSAALRNESDLMVVAQAGDGLDAVSEATRSSPSVAVLDVDLPNCDGVRATRLIKERVPDCRVLLLAAEEEHQVLADGVQAGANGYLAKTASLEELIDAIRAVSRGDTLIPARMLGQLLERLVMRRRTQDEAIRRMSRLTPREREVLTLLARGGDNDSIAQALVISPQTARTHIQNVLVKLGVHSRLEAAALAIQNGMVGELADSEA